MNPKEIKLTQQMDDETKIILTFLSMSKNRVKTFNTFYKDDILSTKQISEKTKINLNTTGKTLKQLNEKGLLILLNPTVKANRKYKLTKKGQKIIKYIIKNK